MLGKSNLSHLRIQNSCNFRVSNISGMIMLLNLKKLYYIRSFPLTFYLFQQKYIQEKFPGTNISLFEAHLSTRGFGGALGSMGVGAVEFSHKTKNLKEGPLSYFFKSTSQGCLSLSCLLWFTREYDFVETQRDCFWRGYEEEYRCHLVGGTPSANRLQLRRAVHQGFTRQMVVDSI